MAGEMEGGVEVGNMWRDEEAEASHSNTEENDRWKIKP